VIFHAEIDKVKAKEVALGRHHRPIYFRYYTKGKYKGNAIFEVEGEGESIEAKFLHRTEDNFFEFLSNIKSPKKKNECPR
jgi:mannitol/fructose-specific phosphotransferase system IIA component (Ntr-type)